MAVASYRKKEGIFRIYYAKFPPGKIFCTPGVLESVPLEEVHAALQRHMSGDWGDVCPEDASLNDNALVEGGRLLSAYHTKDGEKFWIITEPDRSATTVLLPDEY
ncbi:hypothetical protein Tfer_3273 [Thermincola ferriacetica]|uniref:Plasmid related protein n=1 Tax=Thermincola ferriacetica TaxID=281456 RepID=A0A0L6VYA4_9FIRM|nr:hypothetical protein [Thermincola ferriacetica]KNZ68191.1 hypothetical protein Tfer_3273 [Thermincola ferriacetica]